MPDGGTPPRLVRPGTSGEPGSRAVGEQGLPDTTRLHGSVAPDFTLPSQYGEPVTLSGLRGRPVVVIFFPYAFSRVCGNELEELNRNLPDLTQGSGAAVLTVSTDSRFTLRAWAEEQGFGFDLLSDFWPHGAVAREYGVFNEDAGHALRGTFFIDADGVIRHTLMSPTGQGRAVDDYRSALADLG